MKKVRLDNLLVERGIFADEGEALRAVMAHEVKVGDVYATSAAMLVAPEAEIWVKDRQPYVTRGGLKLRGALDAFGFDPAGLRCIDVGCSIGGFTDCLLQAGAEGVAAVDVDYGAFSWELRNDPRVSLFERTNIRVVEPETLGAPFDLAVADLSFIGLASLAPVFARLVREGGTLICLVKPQFESRHAETDARGFVADESVRIRTVEEVKAALKEVGFTCESVIESPIRGKKSGNVEYLLKATR